MNAAPHGSDGRRDHRKGVDARGASGVRVLHLIQGLRDSGGPTRATFGSLVACAHRIEAAPEAEHRVVVVGDALSLDQAARAGLRVDRLLRPPLGAPWLAWSRLRRERAWHTHTVEVWTDGLERLARASLGSPRAATGSTLVTPHLRPWLFNPPVTDRVSYQPDGHLTHGPARDRANRAALGATADEPVIVLLADPPSAGDAREFAFTLGVVEVGIGPVIALMSSGSVQLVRGRSLHRLAVRRSALHVVRGSVVPHLPGADVALVHGPRGDAVAWACRHALNLGLTLVGPPWLESEFPAAAGSRVFTTDGRMRSLLPAMLRGIAASRQLAPGYPVGTHAPEAHVAHA